MSLLVESSLYLARQHVRFFPCIKNSKKPILKDFYNEATDDVGRITALFADNKCNSGIACGPVSTGLYLVGFDIDFKPGKNGFESLKNLEKQGKTFPETWSQHTPSGGEHRLYWSPIPIRQGTNVVGLGIDLRGEGGYLIGPGSSLDGKVYTPINQSNIAMFPEWAIEAFKKHDGPTFSIVSSPVKDQIMALKSAVEYLQNVPPIIGEGNRNDELYKVVAKVKDYGLSKEQIPEVITTYWKCNPPLEMNEILNTINSVFKYSNNPAGVLAPEKLFEEIKPTDKDPGPPELIFNKDHFYVAADGVTRVCEETEDEDGSFHLERYSVPAFHEKHLSKKLIGGNSRKVQLTQLWMESPDRRAYNRIRFNPEPTANPKVYNTFKGFKTKPIRDASPKARKSLEIFLDHCEKNVCAGDKKLTEWFLGFFAHLFQKPWEKPGVCLVFQGQKGVGKTIIPRIIGNIMGGYSVILSDRTHLTNHFNSVMEDQLLITFDEAFWSGDRSVDGKLKTIITSDSRIIEHKGAKPYDAKVFDRIIIIGNYDHLVQATGDERRYAVFNFENGNMQKRALFGEMFDGFEDGGYGLLLDYFLTRPISDVDHAPKTKGLEDQKEHSLGAFETWWKECLVEGRILGSGFDLWPDKIKISDLNQAFVDQLQKEKSNAWKLSKAANAKALERMCTFNRSRTRASKLYLLPPLAEARKHFDKYIGHKIDWGDDENTENIEDFL